MVDQKAVLEIAETIVKEYAWFIHAGSILILFGIRQVRNSWWMMLLGGFFLLAIGLISYATMAMPLSLIAVNNPLMLKMQLLQNIMLIGYGAIGSGVVAIAVTMPENKK